MSWVRSWRDSAQILTATRVRPKVSSFTDFKISSWPRKTEYLCRKATCHTCQGAYSKRTTRKYNTTSIISIRCKHLYLLGLLPVTSSSNLATHPQSRFRSPNTRRSKHRLPKETPLLTSITPNPKSATSRNISKTKSHETQLICHPWSPFSQVWKTFKKHLIRTVNRAKIAMSIINSLRFRPT